MTAQPFDPQPAEPQMTLDAPSLDIDALIDRHQNFAAATIEPTVYGSDAATPACRLLKPFGSSQSSTPSTYSRVSPSRYVCTTCTQRPMPRSVLPSTLPPEK